MMNKSVETYLSATLFQTVLTVNHSINVNIMNIIQTQDIFWTPMQ